MSDIIYVAETFSRQLAFSPDLDQAERDELVGLLNKGAHFDGVLAALKGMDRLATDIKSFITADHKAHAACRAAIKEVEGASDE